MLHVLKFQMRKKYDEIVDRFQCIWLLSGKKTKDKPFSHEQVVNFRNTATGLQPLQFIIIFFLTINPAVDYNRTDNKIL